MNDIFAQIPTCQLAILLILTVLFIIQITYWLNYARIAKFRNRHRTSAGEPLPPVSVIVIVEDDEQYIEQSLPLLLEQEHPNYEVVVVNDCGGRDVDFALARLSKAYSHLKYTTIRRDDKFNHSRKIPIVIGLKAASYENVIITHIDASPTNEKWLSYLCRGFSGAELVIGYTGFEIEKGLANKFIRCSRLATSIRYLSSAIGGNPYRGIYNNIGFTRRLFFENRGYTHLTMTVGEDDLFVQRVAPYSYTSVIINPQSTLRQTPYGGFKWWWEERRYSTYAMRYYPYRVRIKTFAELLTRSLFFVSIISIASMTALGIVTSPVVWGLSTALLLAREAIVFNSIHKITGRLGEIKIVWSFMFYDLIAPLTEAILAISRRIKPSQRLWIQNSK